MRFYRTALAGEFYSVYRSIRYEIWRESIIGIYPIKKLPKLYKSIKETYKIGSVLPIISGFFYDCVSQIVGTAFNNGVVVIN